MPELIYKQPCGCVCTLDTEQNVWSVDWCAKHHGERSLAMLGMQVGVLVAAKAAHRLRTGFIYKQPRFNAPAYTPFRSDAVTPNNDRDF